MSAFAIRSAPSARILAAKLVGRTANIQNYCKRSNAFLELSSTMQKAEIFTPRMDQGTIHICDGNYQLNSIRFPQVSLVFDSYRIKKVLKTCLGRIVNFNDNGDLDDNGDPAESSGSDGESNPSDSGLASSELESNTDRSSSTDSSNRSSDSGLPNRESDSSSDRSSGSTPDNSGESEPSTSSSGESEPSPPSSGESEPSPPSGGDSEPSDADMPSAASSSDASSREYSDMSTSTDPSPEPATKPSPSAEEPATKPSPSAEEPAAKPSPSAEEPTTKPSTSAEEPAAKPSTSAEEPAVKPSPSAEDPASKPTPGPSPKRKLSDIANPASKRKVDAEYDSDSDYGDFTG